MPSHYVESLLGPMSECEGDQKSFPQSYILHHSGNLVYSGPTHPPHFGEHGQSSLLEKDHFMHLILLVIINNYSYTNNQQNSNNLDFCAVRNGVNPFNYFDSIVAVTTAKGCVCVCLCVCVRTRARVDRSIALSFPMNFGDFVFLLLSISHTLDMLLSASPRRLLNHLLWIHPLLPNFHILLMLST